MKTRFQLFEVMLDIALITKEHNVPLAKLLEAMEKIQQGDLPHQINGRTYKTVSSMVLEFMDHVFHSGPQPEWMKPVENVASE